MGKGLKIFLLVAAVLIAAAVFFVFIWPMITSNTVDLHLGNGVYKAKIATDETSRTKGLSGLSSLASDEALIMAYSYDSKWEINSDDGFSFPIDVVWLNAEKQVIYFVKDVKPNSKVMTSYAPKSLARYVIELPAGAISEQSIKLNLVAEFSINSTIGR